MSGGNQQKVIVARWLIKNSDIFIFDEPTRGIDVGAKSEMYELMEKLAAEGKSIIVISSELAEIQRLSDRVIIMCEGRITAELDIADATQGRNNEICNHAELTAHFRNRKDCLQWIKKISLRQPILKGLRKNRPKHNNSDCPCISCSCIFSP